jgi:hypothetical protein
LLSLSMHIFLFLFIFGTNNAYIWRCLIDAASAWPRRNTVIIPEKSLALFQCMV